MGDRNRFLQRLLGVEQASVSHLERIISAVGGLIAIVAILLVTQHYLERPGGAWLVASMGASAVLLFAVPHGPLSQPWPVFGGHLLSALAGVTCARFIGNDILAAGMAVGLAIGVMYYTRCIHPPGGATALSAVVGGPATHALGYQYVITPVLFDVLIILTVAVVFNYLFAWRRYPAVLVKQEPEHDTTEPDYRGHITHGDFVFALSQIDTFIDVSEKDLLRIYELATQSERSRHLPVTRIRLGGCYANSVDHAEWSIRRVVDESVIENKDEVIYKVVAGQGKGTSAHVTREAFARWARHEVEQKDGKWRPVE